MSWFDAGCMVLIFGGIIAFPLGLHAVAVLIALAVAVWLCALVRPLASLLAVLLLEVAGFTVPTLVIAGLLALILWRLS